MNPVLLVVLISIAGPLIGSLIGVMKMPSERFTMSMLAFAAGAMLGISFLQLIPAALGISSTLLCVIGIIAGAAMMYIIDKAIPHIHPALNVQEQGCRLRRTATYLIIGIFMHNFPEGMAMAAGSVTSFSLTLAVALAIAVHDIPETICTAAPYYLCTKQRLKSFLASASTAVPTIIGFLAGHYIFRSIPLWVVGVSLAATAGFMVYISGDELIPVSCNKETRKGHITIFSLIVGVIFVVALGAL